MSNTFYDETRVWLIDEEGVLNAGGVTITKVVFHPAHAGDQLVLNDGDGNFITKLVSAAIDAEDIDRDFGSRGKKVPSLTVATLSGGCTAEVHFRTDLL